MNDTHSGVADASNESAKQQVKPELLVLSSNQHARFWSKVAKSADPDGCWIWTAGKYKDGYGSFNLAGRRGVVGQETYAHRISWLIHRGPIPNDMCVCHNCPTGDNPSCVNPVHLWLGTHHQNMLDREAKGRGNQVRGEAHHSKHNPGHMAHGDRHKSRTHPESVPRGEEHGGSKLTTAQVLEIRAMRENSDLTKDEIGKMFGITGGMVGHIHSRRAWKHVP